VGSFIKIALDKLEPLHINLKVSAIPQVTKSLSIHDFMKTTKTYNPPKPFHTSKHSSNCKFPKNNNAIASVSILEPHAHTARLGDEKPAILSTILLLIEKEYQVAQSSFCNCCHEDQEYC
jgi:hypothetical protein